MRKPILGAIVALVFFVHVGAAAPTMGRQPREIEPPSLPDLIHVDQVSATPESPAKAATDSLYLLGGPGVLSGKFQDGAGLPDRQGWTGIDLNQGTESHWQVSTFMAADLDPGTVDNHAWWCGEVMESCNEEDPPEGYGSNWIEQLDWYGTVPDPGIDVTVRIQAMLRYDFEPGEDYLYLQINNPATGWMETLATYTNGGPFEVVDVTAVLTPDYFTGDSTDRVHLRWCFRSDGVWDDEDCRFYTSGAAQIDLIQVHFDQGDGPVQVGWTETCETGDPLQWQPTLRQGPGDFSKVWPVLENADPLADNDTPQFAFIDDGVVVPGTGGYSCTTWCYGPGGYIVNPEHGISDPALGFLIHNEIWSPVLAVPAGGWDGAVFSFDHYVHAEVYQGGAYVFGVWHVRSTADPAGLAGWSDWRDRDMVLWGEPRYVREIRNISDLLVPGFTHVQLALGVLDFYVLSTDGTPAPYFDNVSFKVYKNLESSALLVEPDGSGAYPTIQTAINAAADRDTVLLADGVFSGDGNRDIYFQGKEIVVCSRSGNPQDCIVDVAGVPGENHRGFQFTYEEGRESVLAGLTITGGHMESDTYYLRYSGGGVYCDDGSAPTIENCIIRGNSVLGTNQQGGGVSCFRASPLIRDCVFDGNVAHYGGAIAAASTSSPVIDNCLFTSNEALTHGGAIVAYQSGAQFTIGSCTFSENVNPATDGALASYQNGRFDIDRSIIAFNVGGYAATATDTADFHFSCTDIYGNTVADWFGHYADQLGSFGNINADPLFCLEVNPTLPYGVDEDSPCSAAFNPGCGLVGYSPVGCGDWSGVEDLPADRDRALLFPCYPNPFNPTTTISFSLPASGLVELAIYDLDGKRIRTLAREVFEAGRHQIPWNGQDGFGRPVASGVYFYRLEAGTFSESRRLVLLK